MKAVDSAKVIRFKRVAGFGEAWAAAMEPAAGAKKPTKAQQLFSALGKTLDIEDPATTSVVGILGRADTSQQAGRGDLTQGTRHRGTMRKQISATIREIRQAALTIAHDLGDAGILGHFNLPERKTDRLLATKARAFADAAEPLRDALIELGFEQDFIETLRADVQTFEDARDNQNAGIQAQASADAAIHGQIKRGLAILAQLNVVMRKHFKNDPEQLAAWQSAFRNEKPITGHARKAAALQEVPPAPKPIAAPAMPKPAFALPIAPVVPESPADRVGNAAHRGGASKGRPQRRLGLRAWGEGEPAASEKVAVHEKTPSSDGRRLFAPPRVLKP